MRYVTMCKNVLVSLFWRQNSKRLHSTQENTSTCLSWRCADVKTGNGEGEKKTAFGEYCRHVDRASRQKSGFLGEKGLNSLDLSLEMATYTVGAPATR